MNDTHGATGECWYGFDLDGTLAVYDKWRGIEHIGEPVKPMVEIVKKMHDEGKVVKIVTARVSPRLSGDTHAAGCNCGHCEEDAAKPPVLQEQYLVSLDQNGKSVRKYASDYIREWCETNLGFIPEIVHTKDHLMIELYDDRVKQVIPNKGLLIEEEFKKLRQKQEYLNVEQWIGGGFMGYEFLRQRRGWNPRKWIRSIRAKRAAFSDLRRISFVNPSKYERKESK